MFKMDFHTWFGAKHKDWSNGGKKSANQFAIELDISQSTVSAWLNRSRKAPTSKKIIDKLIACYGNEVYGILGIPQAPFGPLDKLPPGLRAKVETALAEINTRYAERGITADSPEAESIANEVFTRMGLIKKSNS